MYNPLLERLFALTNATERTLSEEEEEIPFSSLGI